MKTPTPLGDPLHPPRPRATPRPIATVNLGHLGVLGAILAMDGRKPLVPSSGLAMQVGTERRIFPKFMPANLQGGHSEFSHAWPRRNSGQHVEEELVQQSLAGPFLEKSGFEP